MERELRKEISEELEKEYSLKYQNLLSQTKADAQKEIKAELNARRQKLSAQFKDYYEMLNRTATIEKMFSKDVTTKVGFGGRR